jgi:hypothetical protein
MAAYVVVAYACNYLLHEPDHRKAHVPIIFDGVTFCTSVMLLWGIVDPKILVLLGNTKLYLVIAGIAGLLYSLGALVAGTNKRRR